MTNRVGLMIGAGDRKRVERAEELGFDSLWAGGHIVFYGPIPDPLSQMAMLAAQTSRVQVGTAVLVLPLIHPVIVAKLVSTMEQVAPGRVTLGVGVGGEFAKEFEACGVPIAERGARTDEAISLIRRLWTEEHVTHNGRFHQFSDVTMAPRPQPGHTPPIVVGGRTSAAARRAARLGDGFMPYMITPSAFRERREEIEREAAAVGKPLDGFDFMVMIFTAVGRTYEEGKRKAVTRLSRLYNQPFDEIAGKYCAFGRPEDIMEQLSAFADAGVEHFILSPISDEGVDEDPLNVLGQSVAGGIRSMSRAR